MAAWRDFPLPDGSYSDETRPFSQQDVVNYLPTIAERNGTRSPVLHKTAPGLNRFARIGDGPHRGAHNCEGRRFIVSGRKLYQVDKDGVATDRGAIPGTGRVTMAHNQVANGNQVLIGTIDNSYLWDTTTATLAATGVALQSVDFLNQRFLGVDQQRRFWRHSALADGTSWNDLDVYSSESSPDRIVGLKVLDGQVYVFNERTIEVFVDQPTETQVYQRTVVIQRGCISGDSIVRIAGTLFFVGDDYIPYRLDGYTPIPIGTKPITSDLSGTDSRKLFGFGWEDRGYLVYYITAQNGHTWGYDVTNGKWHRRESYGLDRWRINTLTKFEQDWYAGDYSSGLMYKLEWGYVYEGCEIMPRKLRTGVLHNQGNFVRIHGFRLFAETGEKSSTPAELDAPSISGQMPDSAVGETVSFQYTVTESYPGQAAITATGLPAGLTISKTGLVTGTPTEPGSFDILLTATDNCGHVVTHSDSVEIINGIDPNITLSRYLLVNFADTTDYSAPSFDDSAWSEAVMPLSTGVRADAADFGLPATVGKLWPLDKNAWWRSTFDMSAAQDMRLQIYIDDAAKVWINGTLVFDHSTDDGYPPEHYYWDEVITADKFTAGTNDIAVYARADIHGVNNYVSYRLVPA